LFSSFGLNFCVWRVASACKTFWYIMGPPTLMYNTINPKGKRSKILLQISLSFLNWKKKQKKTKQCRQLIDMVIGICSIIFYLFLCGRGYEMQRHHCSMNSLDEESHKDVWWSKSPCTNLSRILVNLPLLSLHQY
jgi:hypothetical protein